MAVTFIAYMPAWHAGFIWDDDAHVTKNVNLHSAAGLKRIWAEPHASQQYYPLSLTTHWIEYQLWGLKPLGYHLVNVLLHALNAVLLWLVLRQLKIPGAWFAAAIFALHPVEVESVAWVSERKNVLSGSFYFLAMLAYFRFRPLTGDNDGDTFDWRFYPVMLLLFVCALLSKTVTCTLPAVLLLLTWWKTGHIQKRAVWVLMPLFVLGVGLGLSTVWLEKRHFGATGQDWSLSILQRCLLAGRALWFYAGKLIWPDQLTFIYPRWVIDSNVWWQYLFAGAACTVVFALWSQRSRIGRGPLAAVLIFAGTLFPALGFFDLYPFRYSFVADHFQYLASAGLIVLGVAAVRSLLLQRAGRVAVTGVIVTALGVLSWQHCMAFHDEQALWRDTIVKNPACWMAHNNLGAALTRAGKLQDAIRHYEQALRINPNLAEVHNNLGGALLQAGRLQDAIRHYEQALQIKPDYAGAQNNLAWLLATLAPAEGGDPIRAVALAQRACELTNIGVAEYVDTLAVAYSAVGRFNDAIITAQKAIELARSAGRLQLVREIGTRLELYRVGRTYRQPIDVTSPRNP